MHFIVRTVPNKILENEDWRLERSHAEEAGASKYASQHSLRSRKQSRVPESECENAMPNKPTAGWNESFQGAATIEVAEGSRGGFGLNYLIQIR